MEAPTKTSAESYDCRRASVPAFFLFRLEDLKKAPRRTGFYEVSRQRKELRCFVGGGDLSRSEVYVQCAVTSDASAQSARNAQSSTVSRGAPSAIPRIK